MVVVLLIGIFACVAGIVLFVRGLIKKSGWWLIRSGAIFVAGFILFVVGLVGVVATSYEPERITNKVTVDETKILERQVTKFGEPTGELERWEVTLNWYAWEGDEVTVNVKAKNITQKKAYAPSLDAVDSNGNYGDSVLLMQDAYTSGEIWPGQEVVGNEAFKFGPTSKGVKLYVSFFLGTIEERIEFSLGR